MQAFDVVKAGNRQPVGLAVHVRDQIAAFANKGTAEVDVAAALDIKAVLGQVDAEALVQQPALADQPRPAVHLHAEEQAQRDGLIRDVELRHPAVQRGP